MPLDYLEWQQRFASEFFAGREAQPVVMFVDRDDLSRLSEPGEDPLRSLSSAVRQAVRTDGRSSMFPDIRLAESMWRSGDRSQPPPTLPVLAMSVLAASEMRRDAKGARHNYYIRLAAALLPDGSEAEVDSVRHTLREQGEFRHVAEMWRQIHQWLEDSDGAFGRSTIPESPDRSRIGYPLSQALIRRSDRAALTRFFDRLYLDHDGTPSPEALLELLKVWTRHRSRGFSDRFVEVLDEPEVQGYLCPLIHDLAVAWDGKVVTAEGLRRLELRLTLDLERGRAWWVIPSTPGMPGDIVSGTVGATSFTALLTPDRYNSMFSTEGLPAVTPESLSAGISARGEHCVAQFRPTQFFAMTDSPDAGGWTSVEAIQAYEEHVLIAAPEVRKTVEKAIKRAADPGWRRLGDRVTESMLGRGYSVYHSVVFSDREALEQAMDTLPARLASDVHLGVTARPRLVLGLPLHRNLSPNTYMTGGEPDLELPVGAEARDVEVTLDRDRSQVFRATIFPIQFSRFGPYPSGDHTISADGEELTFVVKESSGGAYDPPGMGELSWQDGCLVPAGEAPAVCGAWTDEVEDPPVVLARRGSLESWLVDGSGRTSLLTEPQPPTHLAEFPSMYFEVRKDSGAWLLQKRTADWRAVELQPTEPTFGGLTPTDRSVWSEAVDSVSSDNPQWLSYVAAWMDASRER